MCRPDSYLWKIPCQVEGKAVYIFTLTIPENIGYYLTPWKKVEVVFSVIQENKAQISRKKEEKQIPQDNHTGVRQVV